MHSPPKPEEQLEFLDKIQRLLSEGRFTATYKFALLHAIADLCVEKGDDSGAPLVLTIDDLARQFLSLYHRQSRFYPGRDGPTILRQNKGRQARVVAVLAESGRAYRTRSPRSPSGGEALAAIDETIRDQPLWKLQTLAGGDRLDFLYGNEDRYGVREISLRPGVAYCFRAFHGMIVSLVRSRWEQWIRGTNPGAVEERKNLQEFLFGSERRDLSVYRAALLDAGGRKCFYSREPLHGDGQVDHFIPWSRYPVDLGHNFVLARGNVNSQKADALAAEEHLERWLQHCIDHGENLSARFDRDELPHDLRSSVQVVEWSYSMLERAGGRVWSKGKDFRKLSTRWRDLVDDAKRDLFPASAAG